MIKTADQRGNYYLIDIGLNRRNFFKDLIFTEEFYDFCSIDYGKNIRYGNEYTRLYKVYEDHIESDCGGIFNKR